jgi:hypothetical protein
MVFPSFVYEGGARTDIWILAFGENELLGEQQIAADRRMARLAGQVSAAL